MKGKGKSVIKRALSVIAVVVLFSGCGFRGTGTGNPKEDPNYLSGRAPFLGTYFGDILSSVCVKLAECHSADVGRLCMSEISSLDSFAVKLGVAVEPNTLPPTNTEIILSEKSGTLVPNIPQVKLCASNILQLNCSASEVIHGYDPSADPVFTGTAEMLSADCLGVFGPIP